MQVDRAPLGIVVALLAEAQALGLKRPQPGLNRSTQSNRTIFVCGMGADAARRAAEALADSGVAALLSFGTAGGLDPALAAGALVCPLHVLDEAGQAFDIDAGWRTRLQTHHQDIFLNGAMLSVSQPLLDVETKRAAYRHSGAIAVDMESAAIASVALARSLSFLALRAVVDDAQTSVPPAVVASTDVWGRPKLPSLLGALLQSPGQLRLLPGLARSFAQANRALRVVSETTPDFGWGY